MAIIGMIFKEIYELVKYARNVESYPIYLITPILLILTFVST